MGIAAGGNSSFAVTEYIATQPDATGKLYAWGDNRYGQLGIEDHMAETINADDTVTRLQ